MKTWAEMLETLDNCEECQNMRVVRGEDNKVYKCPDCAAPLWAQYRQEQLAALSGLTPRTRAINLRELHETNFVKSAKQFVNEKQGIMTLMGEPGTGKTTVMLGIVNAYLNHLPFCGAGKTALYYTWSSLLAYVRQGIGAEENDDHQRFQMICDADVLCIDNLEYVKKSEWSQEKIFELVDRRYMYSLEELPDRKYTIFATNADINDILSDTPALIDRLTRDKAWYILAGKTTPDFRGE